MLTNATTATSSASGYLPFIPISEAFLALQICICVLTVVGNMMTVLIVLARRVQQIPHNRLLASLAAADLFTGVFSMPLQISYEHRAGWKHGDANCIVWLACKKIFFAASVFGLCAIAVDRVWAITDPIHYRLQHRRTRLVIGLVWSLALVFGLFPASGFHAAFDARQICDFAGQEYVAAMTIVLFLLPTVALIACYVSIYCTLYRRARLREKSQQASISAPVITASKMDLSVEVWEQLDTARTPRVNLQPAALPLDNSYSTNTVMDVVPGELLGHQSPGSSTTPVAPASSKCPTISSTDTLELGNPRMIHKKGKRLRGRSQTPTAHSRRILLTAGVVIGAFIVCSFPYMTSMLTKSVCSQCLPNFRKWKFAVSWLNLSNACINPIIYTAFNRDIRKAYKNLFTKR